ncbi:bestrophin-3 [Lepeophtheirus salmonis]|uniref:bestrophin-3 n=1 Tax=Lepeophtheirus salmonis TaxID=72036 RepID=UPI001AE759EA|nr:bestrophin-3-like [Lepeophtheirus salmonis]
MSFRAPEERFYPAKKKTNIYSNIYEETSQRFRGFWNLIGVWRGSVTKLIWHDLLLFIFLYFVISAIYRFVLFRNDITREWFEIICVFTARFCDMIPITFLTGFYVSQVVTRYWDQFMSLQWPEESALKVATFIPGKDKFTRNLRRTIMRYVNVSTILVFRLVSKKAMNRFPTFESMAAADLLLKRETEQLERIDAKTPHETTWVPLLWALRLIQRYRHEKKIDLEPPVYANLVASFNGVEQKNRKILNYGWVHFPLAYTQVANVSVFFYFFVSLFGRQYLIPRENEDDSSIFPHLKNISFSRTEPFIKHTPDFYLPVFTIIEFISYMGWLKVAETLLNPFGDDDDDFQINYIIDRNLQVSYMIVDDDDITVELEDDPFGYEIPSGELPYTDPDSKDITSKIIETGGETPTPVRRLASKVRRASVSLVRTSTRKMKKPNTDLGYVVETGGISNPAMDRDSEFVQGQSTEDLSTFNGYNQSPKKVSML